MHYSLVHTHSNTQTHTHTHTHLPAEVLVGRDAALVDPSLQLCHGALPLGEPLWVGPGHQAPPVLLQLPGVQGPTGVLRGPPGVTLRSRCGLPGGMWAGQTVGREGAGRGRALVGPAIGLLAGTREVRGALAGAPAPSGAPVVLPAALLLFSAPPLSPGVTRPPLPVGARRGGGGRPRIRRPVDLGVRRELGVWVGWVQRLGGVLRPGLRSYGDRAGGVWCRGAALWAGSVKPRVQRRAKKQRKRT